jgi:hypothetical protein
MEPHSNSAYVRRRMDQMVSKLNFDVVNIYLGGAESDDWSNNYS